MRTISQKNRLLLAITYYIIFIVLFYFIIGPLNIERLFLNELSLLFLTYIITKYVVAPLFVKPSDHIVSVIGVIGFLITIYAVELTTIQTMFLILLMVYIVTTFVIAILSIVYKDTKPILSSISYDILQKFANVDLIFVFVLLLFNLVYYMSNVYLNVFILFIVIFRPIENIVEVYYKYRKLDKRASFAGKLLRVDDPNIARFTLKGKCDFSKDVYTISLNKEYKLIIPIYYQTIDDSVVYTGYLFDNDEDMSNLRFNDFLLMKTSYDRNAIYKKYINNNEHKLIGIIIENSNIESIVVELLDNSTVIEGHVFYAYESKRKVYYQVVDGVLNEELFSANPKGKRLVKARKIGYIEDSKFVFESTIPFMNQPVFLEPEVKLKKRERIDYLGTIPKTNIKITYDLEKLVTFHGAILGTTGTGKSYLSLDIIENAVGNGVKVFIIDITGEYSKLLQGIPAKTISFSKGKELEELFKGMETGKFGAPDEKKLYYNFIEQEEENVYNQMKEFIDNSDSKVGIFDLNHLSNTMGSLKVVELYIKSIFSHMKSMFIDNKLDKRVLIVLEEAHSIIPEMHLYSGNKAEVNSSVQTVSQVALQGRKYNTGLLVLSQRTALVSKTILSQVNNYFTFNIRDNTSLTFLQNIYGKEDILILRNLDKYNMLAFGNALNSMKPIIVDTTRVERKII